MKFVIWAHLLAFAAVAGFPPRAHAQHTEDFSIGSDTPGGGKLKFVTESTFPIALPAVHGLLEGWALDDPGYNTLEVDDPANSIFVLNPNTSVVVRLLSVDPDFKAYTPGFADTLDQPGDSWFLGTGSFDTHPTWHIDSADPDYVPNRPFWSFQFQLEDPSGHYVTSDPFTAAFTPEPSSMLLVCTGIVALMRRRRAQE